MATTFTSVPGAAVPGFFTPGLPRTAPPAPIPAVVLIAGAPYLTWSVRAVAVTVSSLSTQYVVIPVRGYSQGALYNPTALPVSMAFVSGWSKPSAGDFSSGSWAWTDSNDGFYGAQCLVGPDNGAVLLSTGIYNVWLQVTSYPEIPVQVAGTLTVV